MARRTNNWHLPPRVSAVSAPSLDEHLSEIEPDQTNLASETRELQILESFSE